MQMDQRKWRLTVIMLVLLALAVLAWVYWPTFINLAEQWTSNPLYSHGFLVPGFAALLLWFRRDRIPGIPLQASWLALPFLLVGTVMRLAAVHFYLTYPDGASLLFMLFAIVLVIGGWAAVRWTWPSILFLHFMIPFPGFVESNLLKPLQRIATLCSTNALQTFGFFAQADGNVIVLSEVEMGIVEACSGLKMISVFVALTVGACFVLHRPIWQKTVIAFSAIPIAVLCNVTRITVTGVLHEVVNHDIARGFHDDWSAFLMMPMALLLLLVELKLIDFVFIVDQVASKSETPASPSPEKALSLASSNKQFATAIQQR
jgi:exosortase